VINFRFHLISLVAVFLALGVGVAMGASFIDRATVDSLRGRVDDLDEGYRRRGAELGATSDQLAESDRQAEALAGEGSEALAGQLPDVPVVVVSTDDVSADVIDALRGSLGASGAQLAGTVRLLPPLSDPSDQDLAAARTRLGLRGGRDQIRARIATDLGTALALLSASPPATAEGVPEGAPEGVAGPTTTTPAESGVVPAPTNADEARAYLGALADLGVLTVVDTGADASGAQRFPMGSGFRYVLVGDAAEDPSTVIEPLATAEADRAPRTLVVAETRAPRPAGQARATTADQAERGALVRNLREGDASDALSTVDDAEEAFGRIAVVYATAEQRDSGRVGHYGIGSGATAPFPTVPAS